MVTGISLEAFLEPLENGTGDIQLLPICHTTREYHFFEIASKRVFQADPDCEPFKNVIYFFYGKAKYLPAEDAKNGYKRYLPVTMIFELNNVPLPKRMLPFDSGGFERYNLEVRPIDYYVINAPSAEKIKKYITTLFGSNKRYLARKITKHLDKDGICYALKELEFLYDHPSSNFGEQAYTVELQYEDNNEFWIDPKAVVVPFRIFTSNKQMEIIKKNLANVEILSYKVSSPYKVSAESDVIANEYFEMQKKVNKYISKRI
jgi:hypothetical protein